MRRSRRNGQLRRTSSMRARSTFATRISSRSVEASATTMPNGSATNDEPQNSRPGPPSGGISWPDAVHHRDVHAVRDGVAALDGAPGVALAGAVLALLVRVPADGGRKEEDDRALERGEARALRVPLVPADQRADLALLGVDGAEAEVAGREVELLVEGGIVRDVHLAVEAGHLAVGVDDGGGVVVQAEGAALEERRHHHHARLLGRAAERFRARAGDGLGEVEEARVLLLAEVGRAVQLGQADDVRARALGLAPRGRPPCAGSRRRRRTSTSARARR